MFKYYRHIRLNMSDTMELLNAESQRTDAEYSWDMRWDSRYAGCSQYPSGPNMPLWIAILDARDAMDSLMEEEDYDEDYSGTPEISINRFIDGKYVEDLEIDCIFEAIEWADENWVEGEWSAYNQRVKDYIASMQKNANA